ncbi:glycosyltransferase family 4 protein [Streptococcus mitis]|uniref:glycosyltransferase family 4 protein n=1 Tax=Streptococcus mitis TaxID=28037 RepID=UPI00193212D0|nr:glycosyltransferase family 4 protein [Streptococcus mitis]
MKCYECGKLKIHIPEEYGNIDNMAFSAHIIVRYNNGHCGGIDPHIIGLCKNQISMKTIYPILIIVSRDKKVIDDYKDLNIAYVDCTKCSNNFETAFQVRKILTFLNIELLHCHGYSTNYFLYMLKKLDYKGFGRIKTVITCHGWVECNLHKRILTFFDFLTYSMGDSFICVSTAMKKRLEQKIKRKKIFVVNNGIDTSEHTFTDIEVDEFHQNFLIPSDMKIVCYVGRLDLEKRPDRFVDFAEKLAKKREDVFFVIAGNGSLWDVLAEKISNSKYKERIRMIGEIYPASIVYRISDLLYLPSDTEGIPMCVLESMSIGTPVLASNVGGLSEIIENGRDGFLFERTEVDSICECSHFLLNNEQLLSEIAEYGKLKIKEHFSWEKMFKETMEVYNELLKRGGNE